MSKEINLTIHLDRLVSPNASAQEIASAAGSVAKDALLLTAKKAEITCGCGQCQHLAKRLRSELHQSEQTLMGIEPPSWSSAANKILKESQEL